MRRSLLMLAVLALLVVGMVFTGTGCKKKVTPPPAVTKTEPPPPPPPPPAPTVQLSATPSTIERGQSANLSWSSTNATSLSIDNGIGTIGPSGTRAVSPDSSTTFIARASGPGGNATAEARITVTAPPPAVTPPPPARISDNDFFSSNVKDIYFDLDQYTIRSDARATLQTNARAFAERSGIKFTIEGHCDERGSEKYNMALGDKRANSARDFLVAQGVSAERIETISYGKERLACTEQTEECWQKCRRDHFIIR